MKQDEGDMPIHSCSGAGDGMRTQRECRFPSRKYYHEAPFIKNRGCVLRADAV